MQHLKIGAVAGTGGPGRRCGRLRDEPPDRPVQHADDGCFRGSAAVWRCQPDMGDRQEPACAHRPTQRPCQRPIGAFIYVVAEQFSTVVGRWRPRKLFVPNAALDPRFMSDCGTSVMLEPATEFGHEIQLSSLNNGSNACTAARMRARAEREGQLLRRQREEVLFVRPSSWSV